MPTFIWRGAYFFPYGEGVLVVNADSLEHARELVSSGFNPRNEEVGETARLTVMRDDPDIVLESGQIESIEFSE